MDMCDRFLISKRTSGGIMSEFPITIGLHQNATSSPYFSYKFYLPSLIILSLNMSYFSSFKFYHLILEFLCLIPLTFHLIIQISNTFTTICWVIKLSLGIMLQLLLHKDEITLVPLLKMEIVISSSWTKSY